MLSTKNLIINVTQVPGEWAFEFYLNLSEKLTGQDVKLLSIFNSKDKVPSMFVYYNVQVNAYKFKDFSSGYQGDHIELVQKLFNYADRMDACKRVISDYQDYLNHKGSRPIIEIQQHDRFKVTDYEMRHWTVADMKYWGKYHIGSKLLEHYNVHPLLYFEMAKTELDGSETSFKFQRMLLYGYFRKDGSLYKIYNPENAERKFIKVQNYIQGIEQLTLQTKYLVITASLKDLLAFRRLGIGNIEAIAPDSENSMIPESIMKSLKEKYQRIIVLFDNDVAGIKAAEAYKIKYDLDCIILDMSKDLSDSVKDHGIEAVRDKLFPLIKQVL